MTRASGEAQLLLTGWTMAAGFADSTSMSWPAVEEYFVKVNLLSIGESIHCNRHDTNVVCVLI